MIEVKIAKEKVAIMIKGDAFVAANEAVNVAVRLAENLGEHDTALGYAVRKTIIAELSKGLPEEEEEEAE